MKIKNFNQFINESKIQIEMPLPEDIKLISNAFIEAGKDIFLVGGAVRDFIQGKTPKDYDLVTNALPNESKEILRGFRVSDEQGKNFGVLRVYTADEPEGYELATYRRDISKGRDTKGDDEKVQIGKGVTIQDDCMRRDLTINALFYDIKNKEIVDLVGGINDIKTGTVRAVGNPKQRFEEDRLRICRIFRFASRVNGKIDKETADAIHEDSRLKGIGPKDDVSQERIWEEFKKAFQQTKNYKQYLDYYTEFNMWQEVFPSSKINKEVVNSKDFIVMIANLFRDENPVNLERRLVQNYKIEVPVATKIVFLIKLLQFDVEDVFDLYKLKVRCNISDSTISEWLKIQNIDDKIYKAFIKYRPSVRSEDLMMMGFKGADLGREIKRLEIENFKQMIL